jgi:hypothetical protein
MFGCKYYGLLRRIMGDSCGLYNPENSCCTGEVLPEGCGEFRRKEESRKRNLSEMAQKMID